jgi:hypothetical protein
MKQPVPRQVLIVSLKVFSTLVLSILFYFFLFAWPFIAYRLKSPSAVKECGSIREGMTLQDVEGIFRSRTVPRELRQGSNQIISGREDGSCFVQLDDEGKSVQAIRFDPKARVGGFGE